MYLSYLFFTYLIYSLRILFILYVSYYSSLSTHSYFIYSSMLCLISQWHHISSSNSCPQTNRIYPIFIIGGIAHTLFVSWGILPSKTIHLMVELHIHCILFFTYIRWPLYCIRLALTLFIIRHHHISSHQEGPSVKPFISEWLDTNKISIHLYIKRLDIIGCPISSVVRNYVIFIFFVIMPECNNSLVPPFYKR